MKNVCPRDVVYGSLNSHLHDNASMLYYTQKAEQKKIEQNSLKMMCINETLGSWRNKNKYTISHQLLVRDFFFTTKKNPWRFRVLTKKARQAKDKIKQTTNKTTKHTHAFLIMQVWQTVPKKGSDGDGDCGVSKKLW
jgi:beta-N-acetylglucosaminidase